MKSGLSHLVITLAVIVLPACFGISLNAAEPTSEFAEPSADESKHEADHSKEVDTKQTTRAPTDLNSILAIWRCRTDLTQTVCYAWKERFEKPGTTLNVGLGIGFDAFKQKPKDKIRDEHEYRFQISDSSVCCERAGQDLHGLTGKLFYETQRDFYGAKGHVLTTVSREATEFMPELIPVRVAVFYDTTYYAKSDYHTSPVFIHHRPLDKQHSPINEDSIKLTPDRKVLDGHSCARLTDGRFDYWVDAEGLIRRQALKSNFHIDMFYSKTERGWMLTGWSVETDGEKAVSTVTKASVNGEAVPNSRLLQVPVGAVVQREGKTQYIKLPDGQKREIGTEDYKYGSPTYEELINSRPGQAMPKAFIAIHESMLDVAKLGEQERDRRLKELMAFMKAQPRTLTRHVHLVATVRDRLRKAGLNEVASELAEACGRISEPFRRGMELANERDRLSDTASAH